MPIKAKRKISKINFDVPNSHLALTDESQGFSCAGVNEGDKPFLIKSLSSNQEEICELLNVDTSLAIKSKSESEDSAEGSQHSDNLDNKTTNEGTEDIMSDELKQELETTKAQNAELKAIVLELQKAAQVSNAKDAIAGFDFEADLNEELVEALAGFEGTEVVVKALNAVKEAGKEAVEVAKAGKEEVAPETELSKALEQENGTEEVEVPETKVEDENAAIAAILKAKKEAKQA